MNRYATDAQQFEPGSRGRVLRNRLGIRSKREMDRLEYELLGKTQEKWLEKIRPDTAFTAAMIKQMHQHWL